jgi:hypothetical protein
MLLFALFALGIALPPRRHGQGAPEHDDTTATLAI